MYSLKRKPLVPGVRIDCAITDAHFYTYSFHSYGDIHFVPGMCAWMSDNAANIPNRIWIELEFRIPFSVKEVGLHD